MSRLSGIGNFCSFLYINLYVLIIISALLPKMKSVHMFVYLPRIIRFVPYVSTGAFGLLCDGSFRSGSVQVCSQWCIKENNMRGHEGSARLVAGTGLGGHGGLRVPY